MECRLIFCSNEATHFCKQCDRPICDKSDYHSNHCFEYHTVYTIAEIIERNKGGNDGVEENEERKRRRLAEANEY